MLQQKSWVTVAMIAAVAFFARSWEGDLSNDSVRYAAVAKTMAVTNDWLVMQDQPGSIYANKPPLMMWLTAIDFKLFGENTFAAGFWSALFALIACLVTYAVGRDLFGRLAGLLAGCMAATFAATITNSTTLRLDSAVTLSTMSAAYAVINAHRTNQPRKLLWCGVAAGAGAMAKSGAPMYIALFTLLFLLMYRRQWIAHWALAGAVLIAVALAAPWHLAAMHAGGPEFTKTYFGEQMESRLTPSASFFSGLFDNLVALAEHALPWWPLGAWALLRARRAEGDLRKTIVFLAVWIAAVLVLTAIPQPRYARYLLPIYPAIALLAGQALAATWGEARLSRVEGMIRWAAGGIAILLLIVPVSIRPKGYADYRRARPILDTFDHGDTLAAVDPRLTTGLSTEERQWRLRVISWYYLDRKFYTYADPADAAAHGVPFLFIEDEFKEMCEQAGYEKVMDLERNKMLLALKGRAPVANTGSIPQ